MSATKPSNTYANAIESNQSYQNNTGQANNKRPKLDSSNTQAEAHNKHYNHAHSSQDQFQPKVIQQDRHTQNKYPVKHNSDHHNSNQGYSRIGENDHHNKHNKDYNKPREPERYGRDGKGENAHKRDASRENQHSRHSHHEKQTPSSQFYNNWTAQNTHSANNRYEPKKTLPSSNQRPSKSSIQVTSIDPKVNQHKPKMDLNIERRPLSPINKIDPRHNTKKISSTLKSCVPQTQNKPAIISKPAATTIIAKQQEPKVTDSKIPKIPSPRVEHETFEKINEAELPTIGDTSRPNTPQFHTISQNIVSDQEDSTLDPRQSGLVEEDTRLATKLSTSEPSVETQETPVIRERTG